VARAAVERDRKLALPEAPNRLPDAAAKGSPHVGTLAVLHQDQADHAQSGQHLDRENDAGKDVHIKT
jgi:hypothetical protein